MCSLLIVCVVFYECQMFHAAKRLKSNNISSPFFVSAHAPGDRFMKV